MNEVYNDGMYAIASKKSNVENYAFKGYTFKEDNKEYLKICLMNLYEKHIRNMISQEEWQLIYDNFKVYLD